MVLDILELDKTRSRGSGQMSAVIHTDRVKLKEPTAELGSACKRTMENWKPSDFLFCSFILGNELSSHPFDYLTIIAGLQGIHSASFFLCHRLWTKFLFSCWNLGVGLWGNRTVTKLFFRLFTACQIGQDRAVLQFIAKTIRSWASLLK